MLETSLRALDEFFLSVNDHYDFKEVTQIAHDEKDSHAKGSLAMSEQRIAT